MDGVPSYKLSPFRQSGFMRFRDELSMVLMASQLQLGQPTESTFYQPAETGLGIMIYDMNNILMGELWVVFREYLGEN